ncbi:MAG: S9 family peptidase, partial [Actinomycetota bacterium]|nr:S9 family peptidase [Actinomycetota bacterium]
MGDSYPRQAARTRNFNLGVPRAFQLAHDGSRVAFLRTRAGDDPVAGLWVLDVGSGVEREVFHPATADEQLTREEIDRRERSGEKQSGVTTFATDRDLGSAVFVAGGG